MIRQRTEDQKLAYLRAFYSWLRPRIGLKRLGLPITIRIEDIDGDAVGEMIDYEPPTVIIKISPACWSKTQGRFRYRHYALLTLAHECFHALVRAECRAQKLRYRDNEDSPIEEILCEHLAAIYTSMYLAAEDAEAFILSDEFRSPDYDFNRIRKD